MPSTNYSNISVNATNFLISDVDAGILLLEDGFKLLTEDGFEIALEETSINANNYTGITTNP